jgi:Domain of unknown function (DUF4386)
MIDRSQRRAARVYAVAFISSVALIMVAFSRGLAPILVWNDNAATAGNIVTHLDGYRLFLTASTVNGIAGVVLLTALYVLLRPVSRGLALFGTFSRLVYVAMWYVQLLGSFSAVRILTGGGALGLNGKQLQAMAGLQLASGWDAYYIGLPFYALGSLFFSYLLLRSRYIPRLLAWYGLLASTFELVCGITYLNDRGFGGVVSVNYYEMPMMLFELAVSVWFLATQLRERGTQVPSSADAKSLESAAR